MNPKSFGFHGSAKLSYCIHAQEVLYLSQPGHAVNPNA
jgi:hypothetical protein